MPSKAEVQKRLAEIDPKVWASLSDQDRKTLEKMAALSDEELNKVGSNILNAIEAVLREALG